MSAFIISNQTMLDIINGLYWTHDFKRQSFIYSALKEVLGCELEKDEDYTKLASELFKLNAEAVNHRYNDNAEAVIFEWNSNDRPNIYQFLKSVECLIYQCSEGDTPNTDLYKWLVKLSDSIKDFIIKDADDYKKARWN